MRCYVKVPNVQDQPTNELELILRWEALSACFVF